MKPNRKSTKKPERKYLDFEIALIEYIKSNTSKLTLEIVDHGIGGYEYWGFRGTDVQMVPELSGKLTMSADDFKAAFSEIDDMPVDVQDLPEMDNICIPDVPGGDDEYEPDSYDCDVSINWLEYDPANGHLVFEIDAI